jgi:hypothetical protein
MIQNARSFHIHSSLRFEFCMLLPVTNIFHEYVDDINIKFPRRHAFNLEVQKNHLI